MRGKSSCYHGNIPSHWEWGCIDWTTGILNHAMWLNIVSGFYQHFWNSKEIHQRHLSSPGETCVIYKQKFMMWGLTHTTQCGYVCAWSTYGRWYLKTQYWKDLIKAVFTDSCRHPGWANLGGGACLVCWSWLSVHYNQSESSVYPLDRKWETFQVVVICLKPVPKLVSSFLLF